MANFCIDTIPLNLSVLFTILCALTAILVITYSEEQSIYHRKKFGITAMLFSFVLGTTLFVRCYNSASYDASNTTTVPVIHGTVVSHPQRKAKTWSVRICFGKGMHLLAHIAADETESAGNLHPGDSICFAAKHLQSTSPSYLCRVDNTPYKENILDQYRKYLFYEGISATCYVPPHHWSATPTSTTHHSILTYLYSLQKNIGFAYNDSGLEGEAEAVVEAMTSGNKSKLPQYLKDDYSRSGVSHVLALSGFHLTIIYTLLEILLLGRVVVGKYRHIIQFIIIICLWSFAVIAGAPPSLVRAALMCSLMILSSIFNRQALSINSCAFAAFVMLAYNPLTLMNLGFQLSFVSMTGICITGKHLCTLCHSRNFMIRYVWDTAAISLTCTAFTAPLIGFHFHYISVFSLITNLIVSIIASFILYTACFWWVIYHIESIRNILTSILQWLASTMNNIVHRISSSDYAIIEWHPSGLEAALSYSILLFTVIFIQKKSSKSLIGILSSFILLCIAMILRKVGCPPFA